MVLKIINNTYNILYYGIHNTCIPGLFLFFFLFFLHIIGDLVDASVCTAFVSRHFSTSGSDVVEVRLNSIRTADLLVNGDIIDFDESTVHRFPGNILTSIRSPFKKLIILYFFRSHSCSSILLTVLLSFYVCY